MTVLLNTVTQNLKICLDMAKANQVFFDTFKLKPEEVRGIP